MVSLQKEIYMEHSHNTYDNYINIISEEPHIHNMKTALDELWKHPDFREKLMETNKYRGILDIVYNTDQLVNAYGTPRCMDDLSSAPTDLNMITLDHRITINPSLVEVLSYMNEDGEREPFSLQRVIAHEVYHAADHLVNEAENMAFQKRYQWMTAQVTKECQSQVIAIVYEKFRDTWDGLSSDEQSQHIADVLNSTELKQKWRDLAQDSVAANKDIFNQQQLAQYIEKTEKPAIEFANHIMDGKEVPRITDYSDSYDERAMALMDSNEFMSAQVTMFMNHVQEQGFEHFMEMTSKQFDALDAQLKPGQLVHSPEHEELISQKALKQL
jgi:hypothetical protein